jgi:transcriptional regulator with XRE-family HTH domain
MNGRALLAWNLRRLRGERGLSQEGLARETEIDRAYVSEIEREKGNATVDMLDRLAVALSVGIDELFCRPEEGSERPRPLKSGPRRAD